MTQIPWLQRTDQNQIHAPLHTWLLFKPGAFQNLVHAMGDVINKLDVKTPIQAIACIGVSGTPLCGALSFLLGIPMITVRKEGDSAHAFRQADGYLPQGVRYVIIDDLIETGKTVRRVLESIDQLTAGDSRCEGIILHNPYGHRQSFEWNGREIPVYEMTVSWEKEWEEFSCSDDRL